MYRLFLPVKAVIQDGTYKYNEMEIISYVLYFYDFFHEFCSIFRQRLYSKRSLKRQDEFED